jgi:hypothetical protein
MRTAKTTPDGRVIADRTPNAKVPHPNPSQNGRLVPTQGVNEILLEDGTVLTECDDCGRAFENPRSAVAHRPSHNPDRLGPRYPEKTLRLIAREVAIAGGAAKRGVLASVAESLNERQIKMVKGGDWSAGTLGHVYHRYCKQLRIRIPSRREVEAPVQPAGPLAERLAALPELPSGGDVDLAQVALLITNASQGLAAVGAQLVQGAKDLASVAETLVDLAGRQVDPEIVEKARKWDQFKEMMGQS